MNFSTLWLKGLSQQGKIYLATSSLAIGSGVTGTLAVDKTRDSIWQGVSYVGSNIGSVFSSLFAADSAPPTQVSSNDKSVNEIFSSAWEGLSIVVSRGATWSWRSITFAGDKVVKLKGTYDSVKTYVLSTWSVLKEHWQTMWEFLKHSFTEIDLKKIYQLLTDPSTQKAVQSSGNTWKTIMTDMKSLVNSSKSVGFDLSKPFKKVLKSFQKNPSGMSKVVARLKLLEDFAKNKTSSDKARVESLSEFFSLDDDAEIDRFKWSYSFK
ncbi:hypothetical protein MHLP_03835 [Candidatus Mycoplasma haematolamae str. Purdue]|uniref:Uncharacterized protein n=1 Tax=Mycoplasma haematolamae (strain Purdue) TaxID=1212765 RepID=I7C712_MYCHA|nr:hypothetical protein [Candidatus Mycoplasma haematolamae]AFO52347.1 hypothetical protein MHLP_03835 [Candidatus Mycoplasma haematolamae str. Purdue]